MPEREEEHGDGQRENSVTKPLQSRVDVPIYIMQCAVNVHIECAVIK